MDSKQRIHVMTLANSIIGVSILAMPFCFKQCGIVLSILLLLFSSILCRLACHFLLKSAIKARLRTFEFLAYHVFGSVGKLFVEIGIIGFLLGTCVAFFVVMGDLGPQIIAQITETKSLETLRTTILVAIGLFCVLPLGLLRNVDSLSSVCIATIGFYLILALKIFMESAPHLFTGNWYENVDLWRPAGILQCIPIFSMALFCQTQLFEIYQAIPNASLDKMNEVVKIAVNICTSVYIFVGVFGYIAVSHKPKFSGNILMDFEPSVVTETMKIGFVLSVACSFPLVIFPCRASLYSLLYRPTYTGLHDSTSHYIPEGKFRLLTLLIVAISLVIGVLIPNIELVLGLVGSTIGIMICVIFPATCFICLTEKNTNERILAQIMLFIGISVMVLGTYANLYAIDHIERNNIETFAFKDSMDAGELIENKNTVKIIEDLQSMQNLEKEIQIKIPDAVKEVRHEPPQPEESIDNLKDLPEFPKKSTNNQVQNEPKSQPVDYPKKNKVEVEMSDVVLKEVRHEPPQPEAPQDEAKSEENNKLEVDIKTKTEEIIVKKEETLLEPKVSQVIIDKKVTDSVAQQDPIIDKNVADSKDNIDLNKNNADVKKDIDQGVLSMDIEAIAKEDKELENAQGMDAKANLVEHNKLIEKEERLLKEHKKLLEELKETQKNQVNVEKLKAVKKIQNIAKQAIDFIVDDNKLTDPQLLSDVETLSINKIAEVKNRLKPVDNDGNIKIESKTNEVNNNVPQNYNMKLVPAPLSYQLRLDQQSNLNSTSVNKTKVDTDSIKSWTAALKSAVSEGEVIQNVEKHSEVKQKKVNNVKVPDQQANNGSILDFIRVSEKKSKENEIQEIKQAMNVEIMKKLPTEPISKVVKHIDIEKNNESKNVDHDNSRNQNVEKSVEIKDGSDKEKQEEDDKKHAENLEMRRDILGHDYNLLKS